MTAILIPWRDDFLIGIAELDAEHRDLIERFNAFNSALLEEKNIKEIRQILGSIYSRLEMHFALEERVMREFKYDAFDDHKTEHNELLNELSEFIEQFKKDPSLEYEEMVGSRIGKWVVDHILESDKKMAGMIDYMTTEEREREGSFFQPAN